MDWSREENGLGYRPALDGVRAVAITLVLLGHVAFFLVPSWYGHFMRDSFLGVDLFFVLSGFLITTLLLQRRGRESHPIRRFYVRRAFRLMPALLALLLVNLLVAALFNQSIGNAVRSIGVGVTYTANWASLNEIGVSKYVLHFWSLAVEGQFYLFWPLLLFGLLRLGLGRRSLVAAVLAIIAAVALWRAVEWWSGEPWLRLYLRTDVRVDSLLFGAVLALVPYDELVRRTPAWARSLIGFTALGLIITAAQVLRQWSDFLYVGGFTAIAVVSTFAIAMALQPGSAYYRALALAPMIFLGRISYSLYLWHFPVFWVVADNTESWAPALRVALGVPAAFLLAIGSYYLVERPALRLKHRVERRGKRRAVAAQPAASIP